MNILAELVCTRSEHKFDEEIWTKRGNYPYFSNILQLHHHEVYELASFVAKNLQGHDKKVKDIIRVMLRKIKGYEET